MSLFQFKVGDELVVAIDLYDRRYPEIGKVFIVEEIDHNDSISSKELQYWYKAEELEHYDIYHSPLAEALK